MHGGEADAKVRKYSTDSEGENSKMGDSVMLKTWRPPKEGEILRFTHSTDVRLF